MQASREFRRSEGEIYHHENDGFPQELLEMDIRGSPITRRLAEGDAGQLRDLTSGPRIHA